MPYVRHGVTRSHLNEVASSLLSFVVGGDIVVLVGEIGAGKTTFVSDCAKTLGINEQITSPTFAIVSSYDIDSHLGLEHLIHIDTYRLTHVNELYDLGFETLFSNDSLTMIEWGERIEEFVDRSHFRLTFTEDSEETRSISLDVIGNMGDREGGISHVLSSTGWDRT